MKNKYLFVFIIILSLLMYNPVSGTVPSHERGQQFFFPQQMNYYYTYNVRGGDSLYRIARRFETSISQIRRENNIWNDNLDIGQQLTIPKSYQLTYTVQNNDSLYNIARNYGTTVSQLQDTNNLDHSYIYPGQRLVIPGNRGKNYSSRSDFTIVVDAGHGGRDPGAVTYYNSQLVKESDIALDVANRLVTLLNEAGYNTFSTRHGDYDVSIWNRVNQAYQHNADLFVSVHVDNSPNFPGTRGSNVYISPNADWNTYQLAENVQINLEQATNRSTNNLGRVLRRNFTILYQSRPAILVETGFLSNWSDLSRFQTSQFRYLLARGIVNGIDSWVQQQ